jgi:hypothetical protein
VTWAGPLVNTPSEVCTMQSGRIIRTSERLMYAPAVELCYLGEMVEIDKVELATMYVGPHFGTVPVPALVIQFRNWNTHLLKSVLVFFLCWCPFGDHTDSKYGNRCGIFLNLYSEVGY